MSKIIVHENPWFSVSRQSAGTQEWYQIEAADSAVTIGRTREDKILLIRGIRGATGSTQVYELPGGIIEPHETPIQAAARETEEETGYRASSMVSIGDFFQAPAISAAKCHVFEATVEQIGDSKLEEGEQWESVLVDVVELRALVTSGGIRDGATLAALGRYLAARP
jgi:ADP-ribose pyrophosphatase